MAVSPGRFHAFPEYITVPEVDDNRKAKEAESAAEGRVAKVSFQMGYDITLSISRKYPSAAFRKTGDYWSAPRISPTRIFIIWVVSAERA